MSASPSMRQTTLAERLSDIVAWDAVPPTTRIAVIDIGSNSVRLVVYGKNGAYPAPLFDERSNCQLGAGLDLTGRLADDRIKVALETITRFAAIIRAMKVDACYPVATAAVRRASNGDAFRVPAEAVLGQPIKVLTQTEEATYVSRGLTLNIPEASGLVADLGGGSIEIVALKKGEILHALSLNYGHLSDVDEDEIVAAMTAIDWLGTVGAKQLFGVGGSFRALGAAFIIRENYPLPVLHGLKIAAGRTVALCDDFSAASPKLTGVPMARRATMPMAAKIIRALVRISGVKRVVISGTSIRDGVIAINELSPIQRADFLVAISQEIAATSERFIGVSDALKRFLRPLALTGSPETVRLVDVACNLADMCWHEHSDMRGDIAARRVLGLPVNCMTHKERVWLSVALYHRYVGMKQNKPRPRKLDALLGQRPRAEAITLGLGLRFALIFAAGTSEHLNHLKLECRPGRIVLHVDRAAQDLLDAHSRRRFEAIAESANCNADIIIG
jgi:exopolyphosphatase/guanosine-5'-triphosphate,3'-diphosphate pyrophosphatase